MLSPDAGIMVSLVTGLNGTRSRADIVEEYRKMLDAPDVRPRADDVYEMQGHAGNIPMRGVLALGADRHVLVLLAGKVDDAQAQAKLEQIAADIKSGKTTFAKAAKAFSEDPGSANQGGDLGWATPDIFDPAFRDALMRLNKGQTSGPVHSSFGWHLIELLDSRQVDRTDAAQKDRAYRMLMNRKFSEEAATWMQEQRASAYVKILSN